MFKKSIVALVTPFKNGNVDYKTLAALAQWHVAEGTHGILASATTGEAFTLTSDEQNQVIKTVLDAVGGQIPVVAGTSAVRTEDTIQLTQQAKDAGANAALIVTPPYIKPTQEALYQHFLAVHNAVDLPIFVYNNPGRAGSKVENETLARLAKLDRIIGVKDSTNDLGRPVDVGLLCGRDFLQFSGEDGTAAGFLAQGGHGCMSVTGNVAPRLCAALHNAWEAGDLEGFARVRDLLMPLHHAVFVESSPVPSKYALSILGKCSEDVRLPLQPLTDSGKEVIKKAMAFAGLLPEASARHG